jgi:beta-glucosidase
MGIMGTTRPNRPNESAAAVSAGDIVDEPGALDPWSGSRMTGLRFPSGFRFGVATSAYQTEGGLTGNNWAQWERTRLQDGSPAIANHDRCGRATDSWERFDDDLAHLRWLGVAVYRFSVEWSRVEPLRGYFDDQVMRRYHDWCTRLRAVGITPMVTLHHFTEPTWFSDAGGFTRTTNLDAWLRFVDYVATSLGEVVSKWITINEPVGYVVQGWIRGVWPPGRTDPQGAVRVLEHLLLAHARAYRIVHDAAERRGPDAVAACQVGLAHHIVVFHARRPWHPLDRGAARLLDDTYNHAVLRALDTGRFALRLPGVRRVAVHPGLAGTQDFLGINHYYPLTVTVRRSRAEPLGFLRIESSAGGTKDDLGLDLDPRSLAQAVHAVGRYRLPILVTEHGVCDGDEPDVRRRQHLVDALRGLSSSIEAGADVRAYLHWTLVDSFEWAFGWSARFGLFRLDRETHARSERTSARLYRDLISRHQLVDEEGQQHDNG